jgi:hypothetical protein
MSGLYVIVKEADLPLGSVLRTLPSGYPHITLVYTGDEVLVGDLNECASGLMDELPTEVTLTSWKYHYVESLDRHDILLEMDDESKERIQTLQQQLIKKLSEDYNEESLHVFDIPHVTYATCQTKKKASKWVRAILPHLPLQIDLDGITIDT